MMGAIFMKFGRAPAMRSINTVIAQALSAFCSSMLTRLTSRISSSGMGAGWPCFTAPTKVRAQATWPLSCRHRCMFEKPFQPQPRRAEVDTDHQVLTGPPAGLRVDFGQLVERQAQGLFAEHMLARPQCRQHLSGVDIVAGGNDHRVYRYVRQCFRRVGRRLRKAEPTAIVCRADATRADHRVQSRTGLAEGWYQHAAGVVARTQESDAC